MKLKKISLWLTALVCLLGIFAVLAPSGQVQAADNSLQRVKDKGTLVMGTSPDYPPYEFITKVNGKNQVVGMDVDVAHKIAKDLGVKLVIKQMDFDSLLVALETHKVDMVLSAMTPTEERKQSVDFSQVYYDAGQAIIVRKQDLHLYKDKNSFAGKQVGVQTGSLQQDLAKKQMKQSHLKALTKVTDLILSLETNKIDGIVAEDAVAQAYVANDSRLAKIDAKFDLGGDENGTAIAFAKNSGTLVTAVNHSIDQIKQQKLTKQYINDAGKYMATNTENKSMFNYWSYFAKGVGYTLLITAISVVIGIILGTVFALGRLSRKAILHYPAVWYIEFVRGTPLMIQVMFVYFGVGLLWNNIPAFFAGVVAVALNSAAYVAEYIRGGIDSVPVGQVEAARSLGMSQRDTMQTIVLPQAIKIIWPSLGNEFISLIKESSIVSIIGVTDLIYQLRAVQAATYRGVAPIAVAMVLYFIMTFTLSRILNHAERKMQHG
ncbi:amino acid ABC transporter permease [Agrilactobacillus composti DSM 18527 = JCM 14202]|uniref:Amino acid ABC transporter permease n=1 Tax=Agrilactobacillus composti DSM 18527 = JCM 14202 TaxID=1423734 RepID=X0PPZ1_9LACO|nr:amino acid ABC transporter permease [Agrilactobacillus composti DSM 18527 = JCM 14202]GAF39091.1 ABC-type amino acid transport system, permease and periplasmic component [Agrilactobacillus composti DSM 18527 = JCM 14202]